MTAKSQSVVFICHLVLSWCMEPLTFPSQLHSLIKGIQLCWSETRGHLWSFLFVTYIPPISKIHEDSNDLLSNNFLPVSCPSNASPIAVNPTEVKSVYFKCCHSSLPKFLNDPSPEYLPSGNILFLVFGATTEAALRSLPAVLGELDSDLPQEHICPALWARVPFQGFKQHKYLT